MVRRSPAPGRRGVSGLASGTAEGVETARLGRRAKLRAIGKRIRFRRGTWESEAWAIGKKNMSSSYAALLSKKKWRSLR